MPVAPVAHPQAMKAEGGQPDIIARGEGCYVWDIDGHKMLDGVAAVMFSNGGSDAVEGALKLARQFHKLRGDKDQSKFIAMKQGYHGLHFGGISMNGNTGLRRAYEPLLPGCLHIDSPWLYRNAYVSGDGPQDEAELGRIVADQLEREIIFQGPDTVAAFIAEPIQGAGGVIVPPANFWPLVREVCDRHGVLLIADEVAPALAAPARCSAPGCGACRPTCGAWPRASAAATSRWVPPPSRPGSPM